MDAEKQKTLITALLVIGILAVVGLVISKGRKTTTQPTYATPVVNTTTTKQPSLTKTEGLFTLADVSGGKAAGDGGWGYKDSLFTVGIKAVGLPGPAAGNFYQVWLANDKSSVAYARLNKTGADYTSGFQAREELRIYTKIIISLESADDDKIEKKILEGTFN